MLVWWATKLQGWQSKTFLSLSEAKVSIVANSTKALKGKTWNIYIDLALDMDLVPYLGLVLVPLPQPVVVNKN